MTHPHEKIGFQWQSIFQQKKNVFSVIFSKKSQFLSRYSSGMTRKIMYCNLERVEANPVFLSTSPLLICRGRAALCFCKKPDLTLPPPHHKQWNLASYHPLSRGLDFLLMRWKLWLKFPAISLSVSSKLSGVLQKMGNLTAFLSAETAIEALSCI